MILNAENLNRRMSVDKQEQEIKRIQNAAVGDVLFTASTCSNTDVIETLLHESGIRYQEGVAGYTVKYYDSMILVGVVNASTIFCKK